MALPRAQLNQVIDIRPLGAGIATSPTSTLLATDSLEVIRLVMPAGKKIPTHQVPGEITVQCLEGKVTFVAGDRSHELRPAKCSGCRAVVRTRSRRSRMRPCWLRSC